VKSLCRYWVNHPENRVVKMLCNMPRKSLRLLPLLGKSPSNSMSIKKKIADINSIDKYIDY
jgi:hypothetical protein